MQGLGDRLKGRRFAVLGRAGMDLYADPIGKPIEQAGQFVAHLGGSAANIAVALARQGASAALISTLSDDAVGRFCLAQLGRYGVGRTHVAQVAGEARSSLAVVETRVDNCQSVIYRNNAADFHFSNIQAQAVDFSQVDCLVITGTALAQDPSRGAVMMALARAREAGCVTVMDVDYRPYSWPSADAARQVNLVAAQMCDIVVGNDVEFGLLAGGADLGLSCARELVAQGAMIAVYKMGEKGAVTICDNDEISTGIYRTNALKPTGAGDAFMGGFLAALSMGQPLRAAVLRGSAAAAMVVARVGCAPAMPLADELDHFIAHHPAPIASE